VPFSTFNSLHSCANRQGNALKWKSRSKMLIKELTHYQPTILCLQEVDLRQYKTYFIDLLSSLHYSYTLLSGPRKRHGILIAWKSESFELSHRHEFRYDRIDIKKVGPSMETGNVGICVGLRLKADERGHGVWISNTHLYWHPKGSYERQRQAGILVSETVKCASVQPSWPIIICGGISPFSPFPLF
jgi:RNA exonuclease NGL2